jgi:ubiquinone biosynthesis protein COQ9
MAEPRHQAERSAVLEALLPNVPFDGWSDRALRTAAADAGLDPASVPLIFPDGAAGAIADWSRAADAAMVAAFEGAATEEMKFRDRIAFLVRARIEAVADHREAVRRAMTFLALPGHAALGMKCLYRTVDEMWYAAGDRSTDFSFYTRRLTLAGVYSSTVMYWLDDPSEEFTGTWTFLDRRIAGVMRIPQRCQRLRDAGRLVPNPRRFMRRVAQRLREERVG